MSIESEIYDWLCVAKGADESLADVIRHDQDHDNWHKMHGDAPCTSEADCAQKRAKYAEVREERVAKGDVAGHEFHGNQWDKAGGAAEKARALADSTAQSGVGDADAHYAIAEQHEDIAKALEAARTASGTGHNTPEWESTQAAIDAHLKARFAHWDAAHIANGKSTRVTSEVAAEEAAQASERAANITKWPNGDGIHKVGEKISSLLNQAIATKDVSKQVEALTEAKKLANGLEQGAVGKIGSTKDDTVTGVAKYLNTNLVLLISSLTKKDSAGNPQPGLLRADSLFEKNIAAGLKNLQMPIDIAPKLGRFFVPNNDFVSEANRIIDQQDRANHINQMARYADSGSTMARDEEEARGVEGNASVAREVLANKLTALRNSWGLTKPNGESFSLSNRDRDTMIANLDAAIKDLQAKSKPDRFSNGGAPMPITKDTVALIARATQALDGFTPMDKFSEKANEINKDGKALLAKTIEVGSEAAKLPDDAGGNAKRLAMFTDLSKSLAQGVQRGNDAIMSYIDDPNMDVRSVKQHGISVGTIQQLKAYRDGVKRLLDTTNQAIAKVRDALKNGTKSGYDRYVLVDRNAKAPSIRPDAFIPKN